MKTYRNHILIAALSFVGCGNLLTGQDLGNIGKGKVFDKGGSLGVGCMFTQQQGINARRVPFSWYLAGSPTLKFYDITFPFTFVYSEQERNFTQPFNKYGVSPYYKWVTLHAGWRNIHYSDYTLGGATFLGGGFELNPGKLRVGGIYGKFRNRTLVDETFRTRYSYALPSYERMGFAAKVGFGKGPNYTDFILFKAWDNVDSMVAKNADSAGVKPMENVALGIKSNYIILKNIDISIDMALSAVTLDKRLADEVASSGPLKSVNAFLKINRSTVPYLAGNFSVGYSFKNFRIRGEYRRVDPEFQTLGSYYVNNDLIQYTISPSTILLKGKLMLNASYGIRLNNLLNDQINTTTNRIGSAYIMLNPSRKFSLGLNYSNYGTNVNSGQTLLNDSIIFSVVNQSYGGNMRFSHTKADISKSLILNAQYQNLNDNNVVTRAFTQSRSYTGNVAFVYGKGKKGLNISVNANYSNVKSYASQFEIAGPSISFRKQIRKAKLNVNTNAGLLVKLKSGNMDGTIATLGGGIAWQPHKKHNFGLMLNLVRNKTSINSIYTFSEQRVSLRYTYSL
ncbi:MAG: hypothetical protein JNL57_11660 [Bacteroidetes bacterium]|nr:hypothetical protein [Bacteroidota bacterium]